MMKRIVVFVTLILSICRVSAQSYDKWIELSYQYIEDERLDSAEYALLNALRTEPANPMNPFLFHNLGTVQRRMGKSREALESYSTALVRYPKNTVFLTDRASLQVEIGHLPSALIDYNNLLEIDPDDAEALYQRGLIYLSLKDFDASEKDFSRMLDLNANSMYARLGFASLYKLSGRYDEAEITYNYLEEKEPNNSSVHAGRAELYLLMNKLGKALDDINRAIRLSEKENPYHYITRAKIRMLMYEKLDAELDVEKAVSIGYDAGEAEKLKKEIKIKFK